VFGTADRTKGTDSFRSGATARDPIQGFATTLQARLLSQISGSVVDAIFGEGAEEEGRFEVGDTVIEFARGETTVRITISDIVTGSTTAIDVPLPRL
jgi:curli production assembly/transport component CsgF